MKRMRPIRLVTTALLLILALPAAIRALEVCGEWTQVDPPIGATNAVTNVQARSSSDAYAFAIPLGLVHWDGASWSQFPVSIPQGEWGAVWIEQYRLIGPTDIYLSGRGSTSPHSSDIFLSAWDGNEWNLLDTITLVPDIQGWPRNGSATAVVGAGLDDIWILGLADGAGDGMSGNPILTVHWNGSELTEVDTPGPDNRQNNVFDAVAVTGSDIWMVGTYNNTGGDGRFRGLTYHYDGSSWSHVPNPSEEITNVSLYATTAIASDDIWTAGNHLNNPFFMHWNGTEWSVVSAPTTTGTIQAITAIASDDVWAVDSPAQVPIRGKYYHWDGVEWSIVIPPEIPGTEQVERHGGMAAVGECDVWSVGSTYDGWQMGPLVERLQLGENGSTAVPEDDWAAETGITGVYLDMGHSAVEIAFTLASAGPSTIEIHDVRGRRVKTLISGARAAGSYTVRWDGANEQGVRMASGRYFASLSSGGRRSAESFLLLR